MTPQYASPEQLLLCNRDRVSSDGRKLKGDLDHIVLMALRKEPQQRYSSAAELMEDVSAYLNGYPLPARTTSWRYRAKKFVRRHKFFVIAATLLALSLASFSIGMLC
jgi:hypothetical protein